MQDACSSLSGKNKHQFAVHTVRTACLIHCSIIVMLKGINFQRVIPSTTATSSGPFQYGRTHWHLTYSQYNQFLRLCRIPQVFRFACSPKAIACCICCFGCFHLSLQVWIQLSNAFSVCQQLKKYHVLERAILQVNIPNVASFQIMTAL